MRKEIVGNGIIRVSHGKEKMTWFVASKKLWIDAIRCDVQTTKISIALTLHESIDGDYTPLLDQWPVFAFLPLRTYGLKFILQGDFVLPSSREEVDGDSPWNQWLLSEFPVLFVDAQRFFCALLCFRENPGKAVSAFMSFVPLVLEVHGFFSSLPWGRSNSFALHETHRGVKSFIWVGRRGMEWILICLADIRDWVPGRAALYKRLRDNGKLIEFCRSSNKTGLFVVIAVYFRGSRRGCIMIPASSNRASWSMFQRELRNFFTGEKPVSMAEESSKNGGGGGG
nr:hypothetical protein CFP56_39549 [Quercus suber]